MTVIRKFAIHTIAIQHYMTKSCMMNILYILYQASFKGINVMKNYN